MIDPYVWLGICFAAGLTAGVVSEYFLHWLMHRWTALGFHIGHHKEFFRLGDREIADKALHPRFDVLFFGVLLAIASPLLWWSFWPVLFFWFGMVFHVAVVYEACHFLMHYDAWLPRLITHSKRYRWWKACHFEHHRHSPSGNYCITFPQLDWMLGTYVHPREISPPPHRAAPKSIHD